MAGIAVASHILRAKRWAMLIKPAGYNVKLSHSFYSLMVGYLVNLVVPRGGEISRCYNLFKLNKTPVDTSFGTVVVERIVDMLCLLLLLLVTFLVESDRLFDFIDTLPISWDDSGSKLKLLAVVGVAGVVLLFIAYLVVKRSKRVKDFLVRTWQGIRRGLVTVFQLENKTAFLLYSAGIWFLYFLMSYAVIMAFPATENLGFGAVLVLFGIGAIAMAAPLPGGTGSYHVLVPQGLTFLYLIPQSEAVAFTFIFHGWQTIIMIVGGVVSLLLTSVIVKKSSKGD